MIALEQGPIATEVLVQTDDGKRVALYVTPHQGRRGVAWKIARQPVGMGLISTHTTEEVAIMRALRIARRYERMGARR